MNVPQESIENNRAPAYEYQEYEPDVEPPVAATTVPAAPAALAAYTAIPPVASPSEGTNFGKIFKMLGAGMGILLGIVLLVGSIVLLARKTKGKSAEATITRATCTENAAGGKSKSLYTCELELKFTDHTGKEVTVQKTVDSNTYYNKDQKSTIYYSATNSSDVDLKAADYKTLGWILLAVGLAILLGSSVGMYFVVRKPAEVAMM